MKWRAFLDLGRGATSALFGIHVREAELMTALNRDDNLASQNAVMCAQLAHQVPLLAELPLETIMRIRKEDHEAFEAFRIALQKIIKNYVMQNKPLSEATAREMFADELEPKIRALEVKARAERKIAAKKAAFKAALSIIGITIEMHTGLVSADIAGILKGGGWTTFIELMDRITSAGKETVQSDPLFFLLRMQQENTD